MPRSITPGEITPEWMTAALSRRHPGAQVASVSLGPVADGTNRRTAIRLQYSRGSGPAAVFVKAHSARLVNRLALVALGALRTEARLADSGTELPLEHPRFYAGGFGRRRMTSIVVMEDVTARGGVPWLATTPLSAEQVASGLAELARLHSAFWAKPVPPALGFLEPWRMRPWWAAVSAPSLARGLRKLQGAVRVPVSALTLEREFRRSATVAATGPQTVLHGDPHPGNTYALPGPRIGFYDWQLVRTGNWSHDVGYFVVGSLSAPDRREHEKDLLAGYLGALSVPSPPSLAEAWERYRATPAFGLGTWVHTLSAGSFQPEDVCLATIERFADAYRNLDAGTNAASC